MYLRDGAELIDRMEYSSYRFLHAFQQAGSHPDSDIDWFRLGSIFRYGSISIGSQGNLLTSYSILGLQRIYSSRPNRSKGVQHRYPSDAFATMRGMDGDERLTRVKHSVCEIAIAVHRTFGSVVSWRRRSNYPV